MKRFPRMVVESENANLILDAFVINPEGMDIESARFSVGPQPRNDTLHRPGIKKIAHSTQVQADRLSGRGILFADRLQPIFEIASSSGREDDAHDRCRAIRRRNCSMTCSKGIPSPRSRDRAASSNSASSSSVRSHCSAGSMRYRPGGRRASPSGKSWPFHSSSMGSLPSGRAIRASSTDTNAERAVGQRRVFR